MDTKRMISATYDKESQNFFDINQEFFVIDSDHLAEVKTKFYGYSVQDSGIYENENLTKEAAESLNGCGAYLYVENCAGGGQNKNPSGF